jgi:hypothetical protein
MRRNLIKEGKRPNQTPAVQLAFFFVGTEAHPSMPRTPPGGWDGHHALISSFKTLSSETCNPRLLCSPTTAATRSSPSRSGFLCFSHIAACSPAALPSRSTRQQLEAQASALTLLLRFILQAVQLTTYSSPSTPKSRLPRALSRRMCTSSPFTRRDSFPPGELPLLFPSSPSRLCCTCRLTLTRSSSPCFRG